MKYFLFVLVFIGGVVMLPFQSQALTISPVKIEISGNPGQTLGGDFTLTNEESSTKTFYGTTNNFEARGEMGTPFFLPEKTGLASWIKTQPQVTVKPQEEKKIPFTIQIPKNAEPGGHFAAILWGTTPPQAKKGGQVGVGGRLGVLIMLRVSGEVKEGGGLLEFGTKNGNKFFSTLPVTLAYRFNNTGGDRVVPKGDITIRNFGVTTATLAANEKQASALPGSARKIEVSWGTDGTSSADADSGFFAMAGRQWNEFHMGSYSAELDLTWGSKNNRSAVALYRFFVIPWQLLLILLVSFSALGYAGYLGLKKYNRWIIANASRQ